MRGIRNKASGSHDRGQGGLLAIAVLAASLLAACGSPTTPHSGRSPSSEAEKRDTSTPSRIVRIEVNGAVDGDILSVSGTATVPDGSLIAWEAGDALTNKPDGEMAFEDGISLVTEGGFTFDVNVKGWPSTIKVWVAFQTILGTSTNQPPDVVALYGEQGELMEGDTIMSGTLKRVAKEIIVKR